MAPALAAQRATEVLRHIARHHDERLTLTALAARLEISNAAMHAVLGALVDGGFLERREGDKSFRLGPESVILGSAARSQDDELAAATAAAREVADDQCLPTTVLALHGHEILALDGIGHPHGLDGHVFPGRRAPFAPPFGTVFLADARPQDVVAWFGRARIDPASPLAERYRVELDQVRQRGWSAGVFSDTAQPDAEWTQLLAAATDAVVETESKWRYLVDRQLAALPLIPAVIVIGLGNPRSGGSSLALAVTGFHLPVSMAELDDLGASLVATARRAVREWQR